MSRRGLLAAAVGALVISSVGCTRPVRLVAAPPGRVRLTRDAGVPPTLGAAAAGEDILGAWKGTGIQSDGAHWPMQLQLTALSGRCATITYPTVPCHGVWLCEGQETPDGWREAREKIESGACIDGGTFRYRIREGSLEWTWHKAGGSTKRSEEDELTARGTLTRGDDDSDTASKNWVIDEE